MNVAVILQRMTQLVLLLSCDVLKFDWSCQRKGQFELTEVVRPFLLASYPGLLTPVIVACGTNVAEGLVKLSHVV